MPSSSQRALENDNTSRRRQKQQQQQQTRDHASTGFVANEKSQAQLKRQEYFENLIKNETNETNKQLKLKKQKRNNTHLRQENENKNERDHKEDNKMIEKRKQQAASIASGELEEKRARAKQILNKKMFKSSTEKKRNFESQAAEDDDREKEENEDAIEANAHHRQRTIKGIPRRPEGRAETREEREFYRFFEVFVPIGVLGGDRVRVQIPFGPIVRVRVPEGIDESNNTNNTNNTNINNDDEFSSLAEATDHNNRNSRRIVEFMVRNWEEKDVPPPPPGMQKSYERAKEHAMMMLEKGLDVTCENVGEDMGVRERNVLSGEDVYSSRAMTMTMTMPPPPPPPPLASFARFPQPPPMMNVNTIPPMIPPPPPPPS